MHIRFTKMQGAGNDFVVLDATRSPFNLTPAQYRALGDRRFGVGADQILVVGPSRTPGVDFSYRIFNNSGEEVEQCGNGARCFVRYVRDKGLSDKDVLRVETMNTLLELRQQPDGRVTVDMNAPIFELPRIPFDATGLRSRSEGGFEVWPLSVDGHGTLDVAVLSMGNPHAVLVVDEVDAAPVETLGPRIQQLPCFPRQVNVGFMQVVNRGHIRLRVYERGAGETLACGTGACAAVVAGIRLGLLDSRVDVDARGGRLTIEWPCHDSPSTEERIGRSPASEGLDAHVFMTGPAQTVFEGEIEL